MSLDVDERSWHGAPMRSAGERRITPDTCLLSMTFDLKNPNCHCISGKDVTHSGISRGGSSHRRRACGNSDADGAQLSTENLIASQPREPGRGMHTVHDAIGSLTARSGGRSARSGTEATGARET
jgi:hypothetical protein